MNNTDSSYSLPPLLDMIYSIDTDLMKNSLDNINFRDYYDNYPYPYFPWVTPYTRINYSVNIETDKYEKAMIQLANDFIAAGSYKEASAILNKLEELK